MLDLKFYSNSWIIDDTEISYFQHIESFAQHIVPDEKKPLHSHSYYEILISRSDECRMLFQDKIIPLNMGSIIILHPRYMHCAKAKQSKHLFSIGFNFRKKKRTQVDHELFDILNKYFTSNAYIIFPPSHNYLSDFSEMERLHIEHGTFHNEAIFSMFLKILFSILSTLESGTLDDKLIIQSFPNYNNELPRIRASDATLKSIDYILHIEFKTQITVADISKQLYLSERQINRYIMSQYSQTFQQRKTQLRINLACKLLLETERSILDISQEVGYLSINTFYSAFKKQIGITPSEFRIASSNEKNGDVYI